MQDLPSPDQTRRKDIPARPIRLADGDEWGFAQPALKLIPIVVTENDSSGRQRVTITVQTAYGYPLQIQRLWDDMKHALEDESSERQYETFFLFAIALLRRAHTLDSPTAAALLTVEASDLPRVARSIIAVALGQDSPVDTQSNEEVAHDLPGA